MYMILNLIYFMQRVWEMIVLSDFMVNSYRMMHIFLTLSDIPSIIKSASAP